MSPVWIAALQQLALVLLEGRWRRQVVDLEGNTYADVALWWAEVERRATAKYGPRETRYRKADDYVRKTIRPNTWSAERDVDAPVARATPAEVAS